MKTIKTWSNGNTYLEYEGSVEIGTKIYYGTNFAFKSLVSTICSPRLNMNSLQSGDFKELGTT